MKKIILITFIITACFVGLAFATEKAKINTIEAYKINIDRSATSADFQITVGPINQLNNVTVTCIRIAPIEEAIVNIELAMTLFNENYPVAQNTTRFDNPQFPITKDAPFMSSILFNYKGTVTGIHIKITDINTSSPATPAQENNVTIAPQIEIDSGNNNNAQALVVNTVTDIIPMKADYKHTKNITQFPHLRHIEEFSKDDFAITCGKCHHDKKGQPLDDLTLTDYVQSCFECHNKAGELKGKKAKGLTDIQKLGYHANALHKNCIDCHKAYNKQFNVKSAPKTCTKCHPKTK